MGSKEEWDDHVLSDLSDSALEALTNLELEFEDEDDDVNLDEAIVPGIQHTIEVLVSIDDERKKVIKLKKGKDDLKKRFLKSIKHDPAFKDCADRSCVVFQIFNQKFNTWVDLDRTGEINDGTHLKAVFITKQSEVKHRHRHKSKRSRKRVLEPKFNDDSDYVSTSTVLSSKYKTYKRLRSSKYEASTDRTEVNQFLPSIDCAVERTLNRTSDYKCNYDNLRYNGLCYIASEDLQTRGLCYVENMSVRRTDPNNDKHVSVRERKQTYVENIGVRDGEPPHRSAESTSSSSRQEIQSSSATPATQGEVYCLSLGLSGKNPVSALHELCKRRSWGVPLFETHLESYLPEPTFIIKVTVQGQTYIPETPSKKKKLAKSAAADLCLKTLGIFI